MGREAAFVTFREVWLDVRDAWRGSMAADPFEHAFTFLAGFAIGLFGGGSIMWWALA